MSTSLITFILRATYWVWPEILREMNLGRFSFALNSLQSMSWEEYWTWHHLQTQLRRGRDPGNVGTTSYQTLKSGPASQTSNVLSVSVQVTQHFQGTTLTSEWREFQRAASPFNTILPKHSHQDVNSIFPVGVSQRNQCDANTEKHGISKGNI